MRKILLLLLVLVACIGPVVKDLEPAQVNELLAQKEGLGLFVLNVHTPYEGKLEKTDMIIEEWQNISAHADHLPADKNTPILTYCRTGRMSTSVVQQLQELGYTNLYHAKGGMIAYSDAGFEVIDKSWN